MFFLRVTAQLIGAHERLIFPLIDIPLAQQTVGKVAEVEFFDAGHVYPQ